MVVETLVERGFIKQSTDLQRLESALNAGPVTFYSGFDPSGRSLHVGHLLPVMCMAWLARAGHHPIVLLGGGTGMVGDPTGKTKTRDLLKLDHIKANMEAQTPQFQRFLGDDVRIIDNGEWLLHLNYVDFLREVGRHFSVNRMLTAEGTQQRLDRNQGLSFLEFNYHLLQSYDYLVLHQKYGCTLQIGGDDQWFNILGGADLVRRVAQEEVHALTVPLIMTAEGKKMGKTEAGAVWIDREMLAPYDYYQYWLNVSDADVVKFLKLYTFLDMDEIRRLDALEGADIREAKRVLAHEATTLAHGPDEANKAAKAAQAAFSGGISSDMPTHATAFPVPLVEVLAQSGLCKSKGDARRLIKQGGARVGDERVGDIDHQVQGEAVVWAGKKRAVRVVAG